MRSRTNACQGVRDFQRSKVYAAESMAEQRMDGEVDREVVEKLSERLESVREMQSWVDEITDSEWFRSYLIPASEEKMSDHITPRHRHYRINVKDGRGRRRAGGCSSGFITMPHWSRKRLVVLHEVAHVIVRTKPWHGKAFVRCVLDLVHEFLGPDEADHLRECYDAKKVKYIDCGYPVEMEVRCFPVEGEERDLINERLRIPVDPRKKTGRSLERAKPKKEDRCESLERLLRF